MMCYNSNRLAWIEIITHIKEHIMKYVCIICGYVYDEDAGDPDNDIEPGTLWDELPDDFTCPECGVSKEDFETDNETVD